MIQSIWYLNLSSKSHIYENEQLSIHGSRLHLHQNTETKQLRDNQDLMQPFNIMFKNSAYSKLKF